MKFLRQKYWSEQPFRSPGDLPKPGIKPGSPALQVDSLPAEPQGKPKNTGVSSRFLLQWIFSTQGLNPGFLHDRWILYPLSHQGSPRSGLSYIQMKQTEVVVSCGDLLHYVLTPNTHSFCTCEVSPKTGSLLEEIQVWKRVNRFRVKAGSGVPTSPAGSRGGVHICTPMRWPDHSWMPDLPTGATRVSPGP